MWGYCVVALLYYVSFTARRRRPAARTHECGAIRCSCEPVAAEECTTHSFLVEFEDEGSLFYDSLDLVTRTGGAVVSETFGAALGTLVWPGFGTSVVGLLCGAICWVV